MDIKQIKANVYYGVKLNELNGVELARLRKLYPIDDLKECGENWFNIVKDSDIRSKLTLNQIRKIFGLEPADDEISDMIFVKGSDCKRIFDCC